jgi:uncharacterized protein (TIGR00725 family)
MEIYGNIYYDVKKQLWTGKADGWWLSMSNTNRVTVHFENPFSLEKSRNYRIMISVICGDGQFEAQNVKTDSFDMVCVSYGDDLCGVAFTAVGEQDAYYFDDKNLTNEESTADVYASSLMLDYEAKYGYVSVMGSASIKSEDELSKKVESLQDKNETLENILNENSSIIEDSELQDRIELNKVRIERQDKLKKCAQYYASAKKFGELWGEYCVKEQKEKLNGCYVPLCTGGGPGIMEAAAKGAREQNAQVLGIDCPFGNDEYFDLTGNCYLNSNVRLRMNNFAIREGVLINYSHVILFWPGGYGTVWEVCETLSKLQTKHLRKRRIKAIFVHSDYWKPFFELVSHMRDYGTVNSYGDRIKIPGVDDQLPDDAYVAEVVDTAEEAFAKTREFVEKLSEDGDLILRKES